MFRCTICQKLYNNKVPYCECGNDEFELLQDTEPEATQAKNTIDNLSVGIFSLCIILSLIIWFLPVKTHRKTAPTVEQTTVSQNIPTNIDKIWNDTPAYSSKSESGTPIELYKKSLENMLNSNLTPKTYNGDGNCRIEFTVADNGKLINRRMFKENGGDEFNNIVLNMLKNANEYRVPPHEYLGEKFTAKVTVQNGIIKLHLQ